MIATRPRPTELAEDITQLADRLQHDAGEKDNVTPVISDIREMRRELYLLERIYLRETHRGAGDAC